MTEPLPSYALVRDQAEYPDGAHPAPNRDEPPVIYCEWRAVDAKSRRLTVPPNRARTWTRARRSSAVTLLALTLPGSAYICQGGARSPEVVDFSTARGKTQDSSAIRQGTWVSGPPPIGPAVGSRSDSEPAWYPPQPEWFAEYPAAAQMHNEDSTLTFRCRPLQLRGALHCAEELERIEDTNGPRTTATGHHRLAQGRRRQVLPQCGPPHTSLAALGDPRGRAAPLKDVTAAFVRHRPLSGWAS